MQTELEVCRAGSAGIEELLPLFNAYRRFFKADAVLEDSREFLTSRLATESAVVFLARSQGAACGFILLYPLWSSWHCKRVWFLSDLYVAPEFRGRGAGKQLVERVKQHAGETGASSVMVELPHSEPHLRSFYDSLGFRRDALFDLARYQPE